MCIACKTESCNCVKTISVIDGKINGVVSPCTGTATAFCKTVANFWKSDAVNLGYSNILSCKFQARINRKMKSNYDKKFIGMLEFIVNKSTYE